MRQLFVGLILVTTSCSQGVLTQTARIPIYLNFNSHNETSDTNYNSGATWCGHRDLVKQLIDLVVSKGIKYDAQHDSLFITSMHSFDATCSSYTGQTILTYQNSKSGNIEIDAHSHEALDNYADVTKRLSDSGVNVSKVVGGFTFDQVSGTTTDWELMQNALAGKTYPAYSYTFDYLWGAGSSGHTNDDYSFGFWKPKSKSEFTTHDPSKRLLYIGNGCSAVVPATTSSSQASTNATYIVNIIKNVINYASARVSANGEFYTQTIQMDHKNFNSNYMTTVSSIMDQLQPYVDSGQIIYATLNEKVAAWQKYGSRNFRLPCSSIPQ